MLGSAIKRGRLGLIAMQKAVQNFTDRSEAGQQQVVKYAHPLTDNTFLVSGRVKKMQTLFVI